MHDEHFLSRLDRLDEVQVEDALALYYDAGLVRQILAHAQERGHGDRVAISLDDAREGPFIVVTQEGDFVTALGRGMSLGPLPVVPRAVWDAARRDQERLNDAFARADELSRGKLASLSKELTSRGPLVSREVMSVMITLGRLVPQRVLRRWSDAQSELSAALKMVDNRARWQRVDDDFLDSVGRSLWVVGHTSVMLGATRLKELAHDDPLRADLSHLPATLYCSRLGITGPLIRGLWLTGKFGPIFFAGCKERFRDPPRREYAMDAALGMAVIANRFSKYRGEAKKALTIAERPDETSADRVRRHWGRIAALALELPADGQRTILVEFGRAAWADFCDASKPRNPLQAVNADELPDEATLPMFATHAFDLWRVEHPAQVGMAHIPASCMLEAEELYLPKRYAELLPAFDFVRSMKPAFERHREERAQAPIRVEPKVGRNEACPCGSGRKWKRCCGVGVVHGR